MRTLVRKQPCRGSSQSQLLWHFRQGSERSQELIEGMVTLANTGNLQISTDPHAKCCYSS